MKKIILLLILGFCLFSFTSCKNGSSNEKKEYEIVYHVEGGVLEETIQKFTNHDDVVLKTPTRPGYHFDGWYNARGVKINKAYANKDYELFAKWIKKELSEKEYIVEYLDINIIKQVDITTDGLKVIAELPEVDMLTTDVIIGYGEHTQMLRDSDDAYCVSLQNTFIEDLDANYQNSVSMRVYYEIENPESVNCYYSKIQIFNILDLVTQEFNELEQKILLANKKVGVIAFDLDTSKYKVSSNSDYYNTTIEYDSDHTYIKVTVVLNGEYKIYKDAQLYINGYLTTKNFEVNSERTILVYNIKDPNWTQGW